MPERQELKEGRPDRGILNRTLFGAAAVGMACGGYGSISGGGAVPVWGQPASFIGLAALLSAAGYRLAARSEAMAGTGLRAVADVILWGLGRVVPGLTVGILMDAMLIRSSANGLPFGVVLLQQRPSGLDVFSRNAMAPSLMEGLFVAALGSIPVLLAARAAPRFLIAAALAGLALLCGTAGWMCASGPFAASSADGAALLSGMAFLLAGAALHEAFRDPIAFRLDAAVLCFVANTLCATLFAAASLPLLWLTVPFMTVTAGRLFNRQTGEAGPDPTLGMTILAFPMLQLLMGHSRTGLEVLIGALLLSLGWGFISWFGVERPFLRLLAARTRLSWSR